MPDRGTRWSDGKVLPSAVTDEGSTTAEVSHERQYVWDPIGLAWVRMTQPGAGGGGGGPVTVADGADVAQGATTDASSANTVVGILKAIKAAVQGTLTVATHAVTQSGVWTTARSWTLSSGTDSVNVGNFPATQPVSAASLPLPTGAATEATLASVARDASLTTIFGSAVETPTPFTVLDNLNRLNKSLAQNQKNTADLLKVMTPKATPSKAQTTLLHRS